MSEQKYLGEFEQVILLAVMRLGTDAYGKTIRELLSEQLSRDVTVGALYATLERLEVKGMVSSTMGEPTKERGGRAKKYFKITAKGQQALKRSKDALTLMWQGLSLRGGIVGIGYGS
ncbi:PadR family transcriptional regulator [Planctobacterium marinum]|uniref:PadR family transcriptional regulator n=1 Tax=Planctobacterium marinum TaxID=1631968 RepID=UPI0030C74E56